MGQALPRAPAGHPVHYERRRPEETTLYQLVQEYLETFLGQVEAETGASLPEFVKDESTLFSNAASSPMDFCGYAAPSAPMRSG